MRVPEDVKYEVLAQWLRSADADLALAEHLISQVARFPNAIAFHSQQAAEKYLKAFLTWHQVLFPKTHDLGQLLDLAATVDDNLATSLRDVIVLTLYGVDLRYPGDRPDATPDEARQAVELAQMVRKAVSGVLPSGPVYRPPVERDQ